MRHAKTTASSRFIFLFLFCLSVLAGSLFADSPDHQTPDEEKEEEEDCEKCEEDKSDCKEATCGDPFYLHNGEFFWDKEFLSQPESPLNLAFRLRYSTFSDYNGVTGARWTPNYNMRVYETDAGNLIVRKNKGTRAEYRDDNSDNVFESFNLRNETVTILGNGTYRLTTRKQLDYNFDTDGKLTSIVDTKGNELRISYEGSAKHPVYGLPIFTNLEIAESTDLSNRQTEPVAVVRDFRISKVEEYLNGSATGRFLEYVYDAQSGQLVQVHDQSWDDQAETGLRVQLSYDVIGRGDLEVVTDPNGHDFSFSYYSDPALKYEAYYRFVESFVGESCSDCSKRWLTYYGGNGANGPRVKKQVQGPDRNNPIGEIVEVTSYSSSYTDTRYTLKEFDVDGVQIGADRYRYERVYFVLDDYGEKRVDRKYVSEDTSYTADEITAQFVFYDSNPSSGDYHGAGKEYLSGRVKAEILKNGSRIDYDYDSSGNLTREAQWVDASGTRLRAMEMQYDSNNNRTRETIFYEEGGSPVGGKFITVYEYDSLSRMTAEKRVETPSDAEASWTYVTHSKTYVVSSSRLLTETKPNGKVTQYEYPDTDSDPANDDVSIYLVTRMFDPANPADQVKYTHDGNGYRDSMTNALNQTWFYVNDNLGRPQIEVDPLGYQTTYEYTSGGANVASVENGIKTGEVSRKMGYGYDALSRRNLVSRVDDSDTEIPQQKYSYDNEGRMVETEVTVEVDALGVPTAEVVMSRNHYTVRGWLDTTTTPHPDGDVTVSYEYDDAGRVAAVLEPTENGTVRTENIYDGLDRTVERVEAVGTALQRSISYIYDALGNTLSVTYSGGYNDQSQIYGEISITRYYYDALGRQVGINWDPANGVPDVDGARELPVLMTYDDCCYNLASRTDGEGNTTIYTYDDDGRRIGINWDFNTDAPLANYEGELPQKMFYDLGGNLLSRTDGEGNTAYYHYDAGNRQTHMSVPQASGQSLSGNWWETSTNVLSEQSFNGFGQALAVVNLTGGNASNEYDRFGRLENSTDLKGLTLDYAYNNFDQVRTITYPEVNAGDGVTTMSNTYNSVNPRLLDSSSDRAGNSTSFTYTLRGQQLTVTTSLGAVTIYGYDVLGRRTSETTDVDFDGNDDTTLYGYDQFNQKVNVIFADHVATTHERIQTLTYTDYGRLDTQAGAATYDVDYDYDLAGNRTQMTTQYGDVNATPSKEADATTIWHFDKRNQLERKEYPDTTDYDYTYDDAGNLLTRTDAKEQQTQYFYNEYNLLEVTRYPNDTDVKFVYDALGRRTEMYEGGTADISGNYTGGSLTEEWSYYSNNLVNINKQHTSGYLLSYTYTPEGQRETRTTDKLAGGDVWTLTYDYDAAGRMVTLLDPQVSATPFSYTYNPDASLVEDRVNPTGSKLHQAYDVNGRLASIATKNSSGTNLDSHGYTYNRVGLRQEQTLSSGAVRYYDYDERGQLVKADAGVPTFDFEYDFDAIGNRLSTYVNGSATTYTPDNLNQYDAISGFNVPVYDANGSLTLLGVTTYEWDDENRMVEIYNASRKTVSTYDGLSRRIKRQEYLNNTPTDTIYYVYDGNLPILEVGQGDVKLRSYTRGLDVTQTLDSAGGVGSLLAMTIHDGSIGTLGSYTYGYDGNGNVTILLDSSGVVVASYEYDPFGRVLSSSGSLASVNPYQFSTKEYESTWNINYYLYRFYAPGLGRWPSRDPIGEEGGVNVYGFGLNSPINTFDVLGNVSFWSGETRTPRERANDNFRKQRNKPGPVSFFLKKKFSLPKFNPNFSKSFSVSGCVPSGVPGVVVCLTGSVNVKVGKCCKKDGSEGKMAESSGSVTAGPGIGTGGWSVSDDIVAVDFDFGMPVCPTATKPTVKGKIEFSGSVSMGAIVASSGCGYTFPGGSWSCGGGVSASGGTGGANASVQGGISVSGQFLRE